MDEIKCSKCGAAAGGYKCDVCGAESAEHDMGHACGADHCMVKCSGCNEAELKCSCQEPVAAPM